MTPINVVGYCKECGAEVTDWDEMEGYEGIYECPKCYHPHAKGELWDEVPYYIKEK
jgi:DNA-directed RNA polymerase subunit RPC12/RpoP